jgi:voltage-gated potassium channel Kch
MSSTAFVLQTLAEKKQLLARHGRESFAILLFQDLAVIPLLTALPFLGVSLAGAATASAGKGWIDAAKAVAIIAALVVSSRVLLRPLFRIVATLGGREIFTATALLLVIGVTLLMQEANLTASLGAFLAGMLLADSEYRHELDADIQPFKGLLMGLFFIAVGMSANIGLLAQQPLTIAILVCGILVIKFLILFAIGRFGGATASEARKLGLALAQGGEFAFVLFAAAAERGIVTTSVSQLLVVAVTVSMLAAPLLFLLEDKLLGPWLDRVQTRDFDAIDHAEGHVVIAGYGRVGQIVTRMLALKKVPFIALEKDADQVDNIRKFGGKLYFGDATRLDLLHSANVGSARLFVLAIDDPEDSVRCAELLRHHFPNLPIIARARNRNHAHRLRDLGVTRFYRETWYSSLEMAQQALLQLGFPVSDVVTSITKFRDHDLALLRRQQAVFRDPAKFMQTSREASAELQALFESDEQEH